MNPTPSPYRPLLRPLRWALFLVATAGCSSGPIEDVRPLDLDDVPAAIAEASRVDFSVADDAMLAKTVGRMLSAVKTPKLDVESRATASSLLERSAEALADRSRNVRDLEDLSLSDLQARIAVPAGLRGASLLYEDDERSDAFRLIQKVDQRYPSHALRDEAGELLWSIGTSFASDKRKRLFLFPYSNRAPAVFEYLSSEYPTHPRSDDALIRLANTYADDRLFELAIEKHRELVLWAPSSPFRAGSEAAIPELRLADLDGPEYDRASMLLALDELEAWIAKYGQQHELRPDVDRALVDCLQRLADNDLIVAKFYRTVKSPDGARQHAERALEFGKRAGNPEQQAEILAFLESVDEIERVDAPTVNDSGIEAFEGDAGLGISGPAGLSNSLPTTPKRPSTDTRGSEAGDGSADGDEAGLGNTPEGGQ